MFGWFNNWADAVSAQLEFLVWDKQRAVVGGERSEGLCRHELPELISRDVSYIQMTAFLFAHV